MIYCRSIFRHNHSPNIFDPCSNGSGSKEATTIKHNRGRAETSGPGQEHVPMPPTMNDKYVDLMALGEFLEKVK